MKTKTQAANQRNWAATTLSVFIASVALSSAAQPPPGDHPPASASASGSAAPVDLTRVQAEEQLMSLRLMTGISRSWLHTPPANPPATSESAPGTTQKSTGLALRLGLGPTVTRDLTIYFELGAQFHEKSTHLTLAAAPTWVLWRPRDYSLTATAILGAAHNAYDADLCRPPHCPGKFQPHVGLEVGWWGPLGVAASDDPVSRRLNRLAELANEYRAECLGTADGKSNAESATCQARAEIMGAIRDLLDSHGDDQCELAKPLLDEKKNVREGALKQIERCHSIAAERRHSFVVQPKWGIAPRFTYTFARDIPRVMTLELVLGLAL